MSTSGTFKPTEGKREEFRRYLEKSGVMDALTKVLVCLYEEPDKPSDPLQYLITKLTLQTGGETVEQMRGQLLEAFARIDDLEKENRALKGENQQKFLKMILPNIYKANVYKKKLYKRNVYKRNIYKWSAFKASLTPFSYLK